MDIKLSGDSLVIENGDLVLVDGIEAIAQHLRIRLRFFRGEWFADQRIGLPFYESIFVKRPNLNIIRSILREAILETPGIVGIQALDTQLNAATRTLTVTLSVQAVVGTLDFSDELLIEAA